MKTYTATYRKLSKRNSEALLKIAAKGEMNEKEAKELATIIERRFPTNAIEVLHTSKQKVTAIA